ncbi:MAG: hypothetical protein M3Z36_10885 [Acidobacteriota bacterium]|nr:hypothetical protein [Acidobacteriota bacterium]
MICPECEATFSGGGSTCPHCGCFLVEAATAILKTSTILISTDDAVSVYHSIEEVPEHLRATLLQSTTGPNGGTILIADRRGKDQIATALRNLPATARQRLRESVARNGFDRLAARKVLGWPLRNWAGIATVFAAGSLAWFVSIHHW